MENIFRVEGVIQPYAWGGTTFIRSLLHQEANTNLPAAEYWMGAHPNAPSQVVFNSREMHRLHELIAADPDAWLGKAVGARFENQLPFLFKVLDVKDMLSIQVHPSKTAAEQGFEDENKQGIPLQAPNRNYKDRNHKPELMYACSEFWLLHGFKPEDELTAILNTTPELQFLLPDWEKGQYEAIYRRVMEMGDEEVALHLQPLVQRILPLYEANLLSKNQEDFWAARAYKTFCSDKHYDRGLFSIYFFNIVHTHPGDVIFQDAGLLHAYLEGQNLELMANSDNVLRGGLTPKHVNVPELMKHVKFEPTRPQVIRPQTTSNQHELLFKTPAEDFELRMLELNSGEATELATESLELFLVLEGCADFKNLSGEPLQASQGQVVLARPGTQLIIKGIETTKLFRARVPYPQE